jgi:hypothetical protein
VATDIDNLVLDPTPNVVAWDVSDGIRISTRAMDQELERVEIECVFIANSQVPALIHWLQERQKAMKKAGG